MIRRPSLLVVAVAAWIAPVGIASAECDRFTPYGQPAHRSLESDLGASAAPEWSIICHAGQIVAFNPARNVSDWVAFRLRCEGLLRPVAERVDRFRPDPGTPEGHRVVSTDYTGSGYDRGHLAPAGAMKWSEEAMNDSFFMTNIAPQVGVGFNQHIWKALEQKMRRWACERSQLLVVTGPLYETRPIARLTSDRDGDGADDNGILVDIPSHFFKFALDPGRMETIAFLLPNRKLDTKDLPHFLVSIDEIEARSRLDFLSDLWDGAEQAIESHVQARLREQPGDATCKSLK